MEHKEKNAEMAHLLPSATKRLSSLSSMWDLSLPKRDGMRLALWYSLLTFGISCIRGSFAGYHMNMYLSVYAVSAANMASVQFIFGIWNPINDLLAAWVSDSWAAKHEGSRVKLLFPQLLLWPVFCVLPFWPFMIAYLGSYWLALLSLSIEDTFFSCVMIAMGGLWTDITRGESERVKISRLEKCLGVLSAPLISLNYRMWTSAQSSGNVSTFARYYSLVAFVGSMMAVVALTKLATIEKTGLENQGRARGLDSRADLKIVEFIKTLPWQKNMWCFIIMNALNECQAHFLHEFAAIFTDINLRDHMGVDARSYYLAFEHIALFVAIIGCTYVAERHGVYKIYLWTLVIKFTVGLAILRLPQNGYIAAMYHLLSQICTSVAIAFFVICVANLVDEYKVAQQRTGMGNTVSVVGLIWGLHALIAKPLDSVGPIIGTYFLENAGWTGAAMKGEVTDAARHAGYRLIVGFPVVCGAIQLTAWYFYDLKGEKLRKIQENLRESRHQI